VPENDHEADDLGSMREPPEEETVIKIGLFRDSHMPPSVTTRVHMRRTNYVLPMRSCKDIIPFWDKYSASIPWSSSSATVRSVE
jgi:hypothetical protein